MGAQEPGTRNILDEVRALLRSHGRAEQAHTIEFFGDLYWDEPLSELDERIAEWDQSQNTFVRVEGKVDYAVLVFLRGQYRFLASPQSPDEHRRALLGSSRSLDQALYNVLVYLREPLLDGDPEESS